jgi:cell division cycle protein 20 (cofactor of APC complex)
MNGAAVKKTTRHIPQNAEKILDAPNLVDDYYLNLIDWSSQNMLAIGLANTVYLWNASSGSITELMKTEDDDSNSITSVQWTKQGSHLAIGTNSGVVQLWDVTNQKALRMMRGHSARVSRKTSTASLGCSISYFLLQVGALAWNDYLLSSGSRDSTIHNHDVRIQNHHVATLANHTQEICGLKWSDDGLQLASGGNDNVVNIWDVNQTSAKFTFTDHQAAVKALAWCPWQRDLLATGGGTADRCIRFWNTSTGACLNSVDTGSQVSSLLWSKNSSTKEIVSAHGFSQNQLVVWKYPSLVRVAELRGHEQR